MDKMKFDDSDLIVIPKLKYKKWLDNPNLDLKINHHPDKITMDVVKDFSKLSDNFIANDIYFWRSSKSNISELIISFLGIIIGIAIMIYMNFSVGSIIFSTFLIAPSLISSVLFFTKPSKDFILHREKGVIFYPNAWWYKPIITRFKDVSLVLLYEGKYQNPTLKALTKGFLAFPYTIVNFHPLNFLSFMVWYMDKNRPLPPDDAFDTYRQQDFERRKAEGFPPPLYPSFVPTPEATPEQQAERNEYWEERFVKNGDEIERHLWVHESGNTYIK